MGKYEVLLSGAFYIKNFEIFSNAKSEIKTN